MWRRLSVQLPPGSAHLWQVLAKGKVAQFDHRAREAVCRLRRAGRNIWKAILLFLLFRLSKEAAVAPPRDHIHSYIVFGEGGMHVRMQQVHDVAKQIPSFAAKEPHVLGTTAEKTISCFQSVSASRKDRNFPLPGISLRNCCRNCRMEEIFLLP